MPQSVFWSWQSDRPARETRSLIREALAEAVASLAAEVADANRPEDGSGLLLDHDTRGLPGSPDIAAEILRKIDAASVFVADVTPITLTEPHSGKPKHIANPNVLIELGYAKKALGPERIIQVWNTAFTGCSPEDLPFDMRGRRGPIAFALPAGARIEELRSVRSALTLQLKAAVRAIIQHVPPVRPAPLPWKPHRDSDKSVWFDEGTKFVVNEPFHGSGRISLKEAPTRYVRMLPERWTRSNFDTTHAAILGHTMGISWGQTSGGLLTYCGTILRPELSEGTQATMWFMDTGEVWAVDRWIVNEWQGRPTIYGDDMVKGWKAYIEAQLALIAANGGALPVHVKIGANGLAGSFWPVQNPAFGAPEALENSFEHQFTITSNSFEDWIHGLIGGWTKYREVYSMPAPRSDLVEVTLGRALASTQP